MRSKENELIQFSEASFFHFHNNRIFFLSLKKVNSEVLIQYKICTTRLVTTVANNKTMHTRRSDEYHDCILLLTIPQFFTIACGKILYTLDSDFSENQFRASTLLLQNCTFSRYIKWLLRGMFYYNTQRLLSSQTRFAHLQYHKLRSNFRNFCEAQGKGRDGSGSHSKVIYRL